MSTPRSLDLPACATACRVEGAGTELSALQADPALAGWRGAVRGDLVLVPGFTGSKEDFLAVLEPLAVRGWRVLAYDQRGQYESPHRPPYGLDDFAADLRAVLASRSGPAHVVGHSFGGLVARQAALADPATMASVVLLCSGPGPIKTEDHVALTFVRDQLPVIGAEAMYDLARAYSGTAEPPGAVGEFLRHRYLANDPACLVAIAGLLLTAPDRTPELAAAARSGLRVAVAYGAGDDAWPLAQQDEVARACSPDGRSHVIADAGHSPAVDQPEATAALLDALADG